jgi:hypothetical protein
VTAAPLAGNVICSSATKDSSANTLESAVTMAVSAIGFARELPEDARLLLMIRPSDLLDGEPDAAFRETLAEMNAPLVERVRNFARELYGSSDRRCVDAVARAISDLPYAVVRRHAYDDALPGWLADDVAAAARSLLTSFEPS